MAVQEEFDSRLTICLQREAEVIYVFSRFLSKRVEKKAMLYVRNRCIRHSLSELVVVLGKVQLSVI